MKTDDGSRAPLHQRMTVRVREFFNPASWRSFIANLSKTYPSDPRNVSISRALRDATHPSAGSGKMGGAWSSTGEGYETAYANHEAYSRSFDHSADDKD